MKIVICNLKDPRVKQVFSELARKHRGADEAEQIFGFKLNAPDNMTIIGLNIEPDEADAENLQRSNIALLEKPTP